MTFASQSETISVELSNGSILRIEAASTYRPDASPIEEEYENSDDDDEVEDDVSYGLPSLTSVKETIIGFSNEIVETFQKVSPSKASVEFGLKLGSHKQTVLASIVPIAGEVHLKITLEWSEQQKATLAPVPTNGT